MLILLVIESVRIVVLLLPGAVDWRSVTTAVSAGLAVSVVVIAYRIRDIIIHIIETRAFCRIAGWRVIAGGVRGDWLALADHCRCLG